MHSSATNGDTDSPYWVRAFQAKYAGKGTMLTRADWDELLGSYQAICDLPATCFAPELAEAYPEAKVIILNRDPESWYDSVLNSIYKHMLSPTLPQKLKFMYRLALDPVSRGAVATTGAMGSLALGYNHGKQKDKALAWFKAQYDEYRERIPEGRRIEYTVKDGWKPLCEHLGVPVPMVRDEASGDMVEAPFPHANDREAFVGNVAQMSSEGLQRANDNLLRKVGQFAISGVVAYGIFWAWRSRLGLRP